MAIGTVCIAFFVAMVAAWILTKKTEGKAETAAPQAPAADLIPEQASVPRTMYAPMSGTVVELKDLPDETFASEVLGQGVGIQPEGNTVYAPFDGTVIQTVDSKHAVGLRSDDGMEVLIHVGIDTVDMNGQGFTLYCAQGDTVKRGQRLLTFDPQAIQAAGHPTVTAVLLTNSDDYPALAIRQPGPCQAMDALWTV